MFDRYFPSGICGYDKEGSPVLVLPFSGIDIYGLLHAATKTDMIKQTACTLERWAWNKASRSSLYVKFRDNVGLFLCY